MPTVIIIHTRVVCNDCRGKKDVWQWFQDEEEDEDEEEAKLAALLAKRTKKLAKMQWKSTAAILVAFSWYFSPKNHTNLGNEKFEIPPVTRPPRDQQVPDLPTNPASSSFKIKGINVNHRVPLDEHFPFLSASVVLTKWYCPFLAL